MQIKYYKSSKKKKKKKRKKKHTNQTFDLAFCYTIIAIDFAAVVARTVVLVTQQSKCCNDNNKSCREPSTHTCQRFLSRHLYIIQFRSYKLTLYITRVCNKCKEGVKQKVSPFMKMHIVFFRSQTLSKYCDTIYPPACVSKSF